MIKTGHAGQYSNAIITIRGITLPDNRYYEDVLNLIKEYSIALLMGFIGAVRAPYNLLATAFIVSVPVIYVLNLIRNIFVVVACGEQWFGADSFMIAHNYISKAGSGIALFATSYLVLRRLTVSGLYSLKNLSSFCPDLG
ncbi:MAG: archaeosortase, partial [Euryarchaeota archaeon]|nr:archaeosortase [Euryarchaeota archaeon]